MDPLTAHSFTPLSIKLQLPIDMEGYYTNSLSTDLKYYPEETLSLCDLPLHHDAVLDPLPNSPSGNPDFFEFAVVEERDCEISADLDAFVSAAKFKSPVCARSEDPFLSRSESFNGKHVATRSSRSYSASSCSSSSSLRKVVFGVAKIPAEMELSDMRKRQSRRAPAPMFPAAGGKKEGSRWSLLRSWKGRAHLASALAIGCMRLV